MCKCYHSIITLSSVFLPLKNIFKPLTQHLMHVVYYHKGIFIIGLGIFLSGIISLFTDSPWSLLGFAIGFVIGIILLIYSGQKYNR